MYKDLFACVCVCTHIHTFVFFPYILTGLETSIFFSNDVAC